MDQENAELEQPPKMTKSTYYRLLLTLSNYEKESNTRFAHWQQRVREASKTMRDCQKEEILTNQELNHYLQVNNWLKSAEIDRDEAISDKNKGKLIKADYRYQASAIMLAKQVQKTQVKYKLDPTATTILSPEPNSEWFNDFFNKILPSATYDHTMLQIFPTTSIEERTSIQLSMLNWLEDVNRDTSVYWLFGPGDSGRTFVLRNLAYHLGRSHPGGLGSCYFCPNLPAQTLLREVSATFIATLTYGILEYMPKFKKVFANVYTEAMKTQEHHLIPGWVIHKQLERLIFHPFSIKEQTAPLLFIVDGIDKLGAAVGCQVLDALEACMKKLAVCFIIGSADQPWIRTRLDSDCMLSKNLYKQHTMESNPALAP